MTDSKPTAQGVELSHVDKQGAARMVDVSTKDVSVREAVASACVTARAEVLDALVAGTLPKGEAVATARLAGIQAAKRTGELIPLCHPLPIDWVDVIIERRDPERITIQCTVRTTARTGVEMEAMTGAAVAALTLYDMAKAADKGIVLGRIQLERKSGGKSGTYERA